MDKELQDKKYVIVKEALSEDVIALFNRYLYIKFFLEKDYVTSSGTLNGNPDVVQPFSKAKYADPLIESLLECLTAEMQEITGIKNLQPSYSYLRYYENGQYLVKHSDRPSCQYSVTLPLMTADDTPWTIYMEGNEVDLAVGDMVVYKGQEAEHWREPFKGKFQVQAHLHYVDGDDPKYKEYVYDRRNQLGEK